MDPDQRHPANSNAASGRSWFPAQAAAPGPGGSYPHHRASMSDAGPTTATSFVPDPARTLPSPFSAPTAEHHPASGAPGGPWYYRPAPQAFPHSLSDPASASGSYLDAPAPSYPHPHQAPPPPTQAQQEARPPRRHSTTAAMKPSPWQVLSVKGQPPTPLDALSAAAAEASKSLDDQARSSSLASSASGIDEVAPDRGQVDETTAASLLDSITRSAPLLGSTAVVDPYTLSSAHGKGKAKVTDEEEEDDEGPPSKKVRQDVAEGAEGESDDVKAKRQRSLRACDACRSKKIRCLPLESPDELASSTGPDQAASDPLLRPCRNCARLGTNCTFSRVPLKRGPNKGFIQALEDRIKTLESNMQPGPSTTLDPSPAQPPPSRSHVLPPSAGQPSTSRRPLPPSDGPAYALPVPVGPPLDSPFSHVHRVFASSWNVAFSLLAPRYRTDGFKHPALRTAGRLVIEDIVLPSFGPDGSPGQPFQGARGVEGFWRELADATGAATVGMAVRKSRDPGSPAFPLDRDPLLAASLAGGRKHPRVGENVGVSEEAGGVRRRDSLKESPQMTLEQEVAEDEFTALVLLYCAGAKGGRLLGALLAAAWSKLCGLDGKRRERAEWVHFQLDLWHSLATQESPTCQFLPLRRDLPKGRLILSIPDNSPSAGLLLSTAMLAGLSARANEAAGWTEIREHEVHLTFGLQYVDARPAPTTSKATETKEDGRDTVQKVLGLWAKLFHKVRCLPLARTATLADAEEVVLDAGKLVGLVDTREKLEVCDVVAPHLLGLATVALAWAASTAFALPRSESALELISSSTHLLSHLAGLSTACCAPSPPPTNGNGSEPKFPMRAYLEQIARYADVASRTPSEGGDKIRVTVLELGYLGAF